MMEHALALDMLTFSKRDERAELIRELVEVHRVAARCHLPAPKLRAIKPSITAHSTVPLNSTLGVSGVDRTSNEGCIDFHPTKSSPVYIPMN